jgi:large subunit ribosomal protein L19e
MTQLQKRLAAQVLKCSQHRVRFDSERHEDIKGAITKVDIRSLVKDKAIYALPERHPSRVRARKRQLQRSKGRRRGMGTRKGTRNARKSTKRVWVEKIRAQRALLKQLKDKKTITTAMYRNLNAKATGGFFRSLRHVKLYVTEQLKK